jgi:hypothetical protein
MGGYVLNDNAEPDFIDFIRDPANGFISITLPIKRGTELALKVGHGSAAQAGEAVCCPQHRMEAA